jgi:hypothetical protein
MILADIKTRSMMSLFEFATGLIRRSEDCPRKGFRELASRCVQATASASTSITNCVSIPGNSLSLVLYICLLAWVDQYAAWYAIGISMLLPVFGFFHSGILRKAKRNVSRLKDRNEMGLGYLLAKADPDADIVSDLAWNQLSLSDAIATQDAGIDFDKIVYGTVGRVNVFAGLLIGGLQHEAFGMGHTIAVFFLLSIFTTVLTRWSKRIVSLPEFHFSVRSLLDLFSDFTTRPVSFTAFSDARDESSSVEDQAVASRRRSISRGDS